MTKREREKVVEEKLKRWRKLQEEVWQAEEDAVNIAFSNGEGEPVQSSSISDKTARGAFMLDSASEKRRFVDALTEGMKWLEEEQPDLQRLLYGHYGMRYMRGYKQKHAEAFRKSYCKVYTISRTQYHKRRVDALDELATFLTFKGLLRICKNYNSELYIKNP